MKLFIAMSKPNQAIADCAGIRLGQHRQQDFTLPLCGAGIPLDIKPIGIRAGAPFA